MIEFAIDGLPFGGGVPGRVQVRRFTIGEASLVTTDLVNPAGRGGILPGRDLPGGRTLAWDLFTNENTEREARARAQELGAAWRPELAPLSVVPLTITSDGQTWVVYGRPRSWVPPEPNVTMRQGRADITCDFLATDPVFYAGAEQSVALGIVPASSAALKLPTAPPFTWRSAGEPQARTAVVGGDASTPVRVTFEGPVTRPWIRVGGVLVELTGTLAYDEAVTVDARAMTVRRADGASVPGMLAPRARMVDLRLPPGSHEVTFGGIDETGTARATVAWRDAWRSL